MDPDAEIEALFQRHETRHHLPGWPIRADILSLDRSIRVFVSNSRDLDQHVEGPADIGYFLRLWSRVNREEFEAFLHEVDRLLHNYLAASTSLKDHSVRVRDRRLPPSPEDPYAEAYDLRVRRSFVDSPLARFVRLLRNYSLHRLLPISRAEMRGGPTSFESHVVLPTSELLKWTKWDGPARRFIEEAGDQIYLQDVVRRYTATVLEFQRWFRQALCWRHREVIRALEAEEREIAERFSALTGEPIQSKDIPDPTAGIQSTPTRSVPSQE